MRRPFLALLIPALLFAACDGATSDGDGDGYDAAVDCDDADPAVHPGADEICANGVDEDCDGSTDDVGPDAPAFHADADSDGYGDATSSVQACSAPDGYVDNTDDCDDSDGDIHPGVVDDQCDGVDDDCDEEVDEDSAQLSVYRDNDGDGYGAGAASQDCVVRDGFSADGSDCDDGKETVFPGADEVCNGDDDDCDTDIDEDQQGLGPVCAVESCKALLTGFPGTPDGDYWLLDGDGGAVETACDMTTDGGGWTRLTGPVIREAGWGEFRHEDGPAGSWIGEWINDERFKMEPVRIRETNCDTVVVRHRVVLPFSFDAWSGEWKADAEGDDTVAADWGTGLQPGISESPPCDGAVKFGAATQADLKAGSEWGRGYGGAKSVDWPAATTSRAVNVFSWEINGISQTPLDGTTRSVIEVYDIDIWVR